MSTDKPLTQAQRRRAALSEAGCCTYLIDIFQGGNECILCLCCGMRSFDLNDIGHRFCGFCKEWHCEWSKEGGDR
jgi:hypothetical protein